MVNTVKTSVPLQLSAGDSIKWLISLADFPASVGWILHYTLNNTANSIAINSTASGEDHAINIAASTTASWVAGEYQYVAWVDGVNSERHTISNGSIKVLPNLAAATGGFDNRSPAKKCLDDLNAAFAAYGNKAYTQEYSIGDRRMKFNTPGDFLAFRSKVQAEVNKELAIENRLLGKPSASKILVRY
jgi:hypothetical protein